MFRHLRQPIFRSLLRCPLHIHLNGKLLVPTPQGTRRYLSTPPPLVSHSDLTTARYQELSDATMESLLSALEDLVDDADIAQYEVEYHSGVLTLTLGTHGIYVVNKQPPNKQIWLSSPSSGPKRYDYVETADNWIYGRDGMALGTLLNEELSEIFGKKVNLGVDAVSEFVP